MGSNPLAALSATERGNYRTALTALVYQAFYHGWQHNEPLTLDSLVDVVRDADDGAPLAEVHRAVARLERTGLVENIAGDPDLWRQVDLWGTGQQPTRSTASGCGTRGCMRSLDHLGGHLPDVDAADSWLCAELVIHGEDVTAAWAPGSPWVRIYPDAAALAARAEPLTQLPVPHTLRFTPDALVDLVTGWLNEDDHIPPHGDTSHTVITTAEGFVFSPGVDTGTLVVQHSEYFAVWRQDSGQVEFYEDAHDWDDAMSPQDTVVVPTDVPFTGAILDQLCEDWFSRELDKEKGHP